MYYKFRSLSDKNGFARISDIILNNRLWLSSLSNLNDPFECCYQSKESETVKRSSDFKRKNIKNKINDSDTIESYVKVACFSKEMALYSPVMWSHYADLHEGVAIGFEVVPDKMSKWDLVDVGYEENMPILPKKNFYTKNDVINTLKCKAREWSYEQESRIISFEKEKYCKILVRSLVFGYKFSRDQMRGFTQLFGNTIEYHEFDRIDVKGYRLKFKRLNY